jgi:uncharacterized protein
MAHLPSRPDLAQLRRLAKERVAAARTGDPDSQRLFAELGTGVSLAAAQLLLAREYGFGSWAELQLEVSRRLMLDLRDPKALVAFISNHPQLATADLTNWRDHPQGASPLGYVAMMRYETSSGKWRDAVGTGPMAQVLIAAGAPVDGNPGDKETPLITAASYGDAEVAAVLIAGQANINALASNDAGGVPGGSSLLHAAVFGMTEVVDVLAAAGAQVRSLEEAAAVGSISSWTYATADLQTRLRSLIMAAHHQRINVVHELAAVGTPIDIEDAMFGRHPLRLAASAGRPESIRCLLALGADPLGRDGRGFTALDHCRHGRVNLVDHSGHDEVEALLTQ